MDAGNNSVIKSDGYTLIEVMVAMFITLIILGGVYKAIQDETINLEKDEAILDMQNNARVALERITKDLRRTGFFGCGGEESYIMGGFTYPPVPISFANDDTTEANIDNGTDSSTFRFLGGDIPLNPAAASTTNTSPTKSFTMSRSAFNSGDELMITDCVEYAIFQKTNGPAQLVSHGGLDLGRAYGSPLPARIYRFESAAYRVEDGDLKLDGEVIAANIEDLQFEFIEDTDNDGELSDENWSDSYASAETVRAVRVWILAMSEPAYTYDDTNTYDYPNSPYWSTANPFGSLNGAGGSPASQSGLAKEKKHCYRYLASTIVYLRNAGIS